MDGLTLSESASASFSVKADLETTILNRSSLFLASSSSISPNASENARLATDDQLIQSVLDILSFNSSGTESVIVPILDLQSNYLYYVYAQDIFKSFGIGAGFEGVETGVPCAQEMRLATSSASRTSTLASLLSNFSLDHKGHLNLNESATYSVSLVCGLNNSLASDKKSLNSSAETILIFPLNNASSSLKSSSESFDFSSNSSLCLSTSENNLSGPIGSICPENNISAVFPFASNAAQITFASITTSIYTSPGNFFLYSLCNDSDIFLPISSASFSDSLLFATIDLNRDSSDAFSRIASLATSDQFTNFNSSISFFKSSGTDNVIVGMVNTSQIFNLFKTVYALDIFKPFGLGVGKCRNGTIAANRHLR